MSSGSSVFEHYNPKGGVSAKVHVRMNELDQPKGPEYGTHQGSNYVQPEQYNQYYEKPVHSTEGENRTFPNPRF